MSTIKGANGMEKEKRTKIKRRARAKFASLLQEVKQEEEDQIRGISMGNNDKGEIEISFETGLKNVGQDILDKVLINFFEDFFLNE